MTGITKNCVITAALLLVVLTSSGCGNPNPSPAGTAGTIPEVTEAEFNKQVLEAEVPTLVWLRNPNYFSSYAKEQETVLAAVAAKHKDFKIVAVGRFSMLASSMGFNHEVASQAFVLIRDRKVVAQVESYPTRVYSQAEIEWLVSEGPTVPRILPLSHHPRRGDD